MSLERDVNGCRLSLVQGDITQQSIDAIVNAANSSLMGGGGVDGAIHRAGGAAILEECREIVAKIGQLPVGEAVITTAGNLPAGYVIHTVGPVWHGGDQREPELLGNAYRNSLTIAASETLKSVAFPSISTGAFGYPIAQASDVAIRTVATFLDEEPLEEVRFVLFSGDDLEMYADALARLP